MLIFFAFDNVDMESSKRRVSFLSLIFLLRCMSKSIITVTIREIDDDDYTLYNNLRGGGKQGSLWSL